MTAEGWVVERRIKERYAQMGEDVKIWPLAKITKPEVMYIGNAVIVDDFVFIHGGNKIILGDFVHIGAMTLITGGGVVEIGDFVCVSGGCRIYAGTEDFLGGSMAGPMIPYPYRKVERSFVRIGKYAIIGTGTTILPGVTIGEGAAIGANSLVRKDCEPWMVYVGNPARKLKERPRDKILELAEEFRKICYDGEGRYIPEEKRISKLEIGILKLDRDNQ